MDSIEVLADLLRKEVIKGDVELSSGQRSDWYLDCRKVTYGQPAATAKAVCEFLSRYDLYGNFDAIGGVGYGGIPIAISVAYAWKTRAFGVRSEAKRHGPEKSILAGHLESDEKVILVDDVLTTGASVGRALAVLEIRRVEVLAVVCLFNRDNHSDVIQGVRLLSLFDPDDLKDSA